MEIKTRVNGDKDENKDKNENEVKGDDKEDDSHRMMTDPPLAINSKSTFFSYNQLPTYDWKEAPITSWIRDQVEDYCQTRFNYCLVHLYRDGKDKIGRHNDREALNSVVASLSLGTTRKFRFQELGVKTGWCKQYSLNSGDLLVMKAGCQRLYEHWVPAEKKVTEGRLNFTFRTYDNN